MIGAVAICWALWKTRNKSYFLRIRPKDPTDVILLACHFLHEWAKLQRNVLRRVLRRGADLLARVAHEIFGRAHGWNPVVSRLQN